MLIDSSIYAQLRPQTQLQGPLDQFGKAASIRNMLGAGETQNLQQQLMREQIAGLPQQRAAAEQERAAKQRSNLLAQDEKLVKLFQDQAKSELMQITTPEQWTAYRARQAERAAMLGSPEYQQAAVKALQADPEQFDPAYIQSKLAGEAPTPAGHTRLPGGGLSPVDPNYLAGRKAVAEAGRPPATQVTTNIIPPSPGMDAADKKFADEYVAFKAAGGFADTQKQLNQLKDVRAQLAAGKERSGPITGRTPDAVLSVVNPEAIAARDAVEEVVQRNLRLILGAQFTEREGERLIARAYNVNLPEAENAKRLDRLIKQIEDAANAKENAANYFETNGTLRGWKGKLYTVRDFEKIDFGDGKKEKGAAGAKPAAGKPKFLGFE